MFFSKIALANLEKDLGSIDASFEEIRDRYFARSFTCPRAKEFALQGYIRRLDILRLCIKDVFELLPPNQEDIPDIVTRTEAVVRLQAFSVNVFGAVDNLAWIWVAEKSITKENGDKIPSGWIGLGPNNKVVVATLSQEFKKHLGTLKNWFVELEGFRHAVAHRIPLYIPPYVIQQKDSTEHQRLYSQLLALGYDPGEYRRISSELRRLKRFEPRMRHSFEEKSKNIIFHSPATCGFQDRRRARTTNVERAR